MMENAQKIANNTYSIIARSCNKLMIGKTFWKSVALPSILYGTKVINLTEDEINKLRRIENSVWRQILGAPGYAPICTLRGEIGTSLMKRRIIDGRIQYLKSIGEGRNELLCKIMGVIKESNKMNWIRRTRKYLDEIQIKYREIEVGGVSV